MKGSFEEEKYKGESFYDREGNQWLDDEVTVIIPGRFPEKKERKPDPTDDWFLPF
jgi:hypothetical protein